MHGAKLKIMYTYDYFIKLCVDGYWFISSSSSSSGH
jgi:hypothetical protein